MSEVGHHGLIIKAPKKRGIVFFVVVASVGAHVMVGAALAVIKITEVLTRDAEFEAPIVEVAPPPPPPPPPPTTTQRTQRSMPRPQPLAAQNPQNMSVPAIEIDRSAINLLSGRGFGGGLGQVGGGVVDQLRLTQFGFDRFMEGTLRGQLFDFKTTPNGAQSAVGQASAMREITHAFGDFSRDFARTFNIRNLERKFLRAERELFASYWIIPSTDANIAPQIFGVEGVIEPRAIGALYEGTFIPTETGRFRFFGRGDDVLIVRINDRIVLDGSWERDRFSQWRQTAFAGRDDEARPVRNFFGIGRRQGMSGDWINLIADTPVKMEVFLAEVPGGGFGAYLLIENASRPGDLRIFSTLPLSRACPKGESHW